MDSWSCAKWVPSAMETEKIGPKNEREREKKKISRSGKKGILIPHVRLKTSNGENNSSIGWK